MKSEANLDVKNLCSRKLWELVSSEEIDADALRSIANELQQRRHYLHELENLLPPPLARQH